MLIQIDTREQANCHIVRFFDCHSIDHVDTECLIAGDYYAGGNVAIERKRNLVELAQTCGKGHQRFKRELERAKELGIKLIVLVEEKTYFDDIEWWINPHGTVKHRALKDGTIKTLRPMNGAMMKKILDHWRAEYDIGIVFVEKKMSAYTIYKLLEEDLRNGKVCN